MFPLFFSSLPSSENVPPFFLCPLTSPNPHPSISCLSPHFLSPLTGRRPNSSDGSSLISSHQKKGKRVNGEVCGGWEVGIRLHLFHEVVVVVVVDPTSNTQSLPKRAPLPSPPLLLPPSASLLKQTLWTACMTFQLCGWQSLLQRLQQHTGLLKHNSRGTSTHDPPSHTRRSSGVLSTVPDFTREISSEMLILCYLKTSRFINQDA